MAIKKHAPEAEIEKPEKCEHCGVEYLRSDGARWATNWKHWCCSKCFWEYLGVRP